MIKIAFFDIDGTLLSFKTHAMPVSTRRALAELRAKGVLTVVCTGRAAAELPRDELDDSFDAYVIASGQLCYNRQDVFRDVTIDPSDVRVMVDQVQRGLYDTVVMLRNYEFVNRMTPTIRAQSDRCNIIYAVDDVELALENPVYQICPFVAPGEEHVFLDVTANVIMTRWGPLCCEVLPAGGGKDQGVRAALDYYGLAPEEAVAFGDGGNDLTMFSAVGTKVAMGNACDELKVRADLVTDDVDDHGVWNACRSLGLL